MPAAPATLHMCAGKIASVTVAGKTISALDLQGTVFKIMTNCSPAMTNRFFKYQTCVNDGPNQNQLSCLVGVFFAKYYQGSWDVFEDNDVETWNTAIFMLMAEHRDPFEITFVE